MLDMNYVAIKQYINDKIPDVSLTRYATSVALGVTIGKALTVSNTPLSGAVEHYNNHKIHAVASAAGYFNENILVDIDLVAAVARSVWMMRQFAVSSDGVGFINPTGEGSFIDKFFGATIYLDPQVQAFLNKHNAVMITIINRMDAQVQELLKTQAQ